MSAKPGRMATKLPVGSISITAEDAFANNFSARWMRKIGNACRFLLKFYLSGSG
jgi:hypothetical protein